MFHSIKNRMMKKLFLFSSLLLVILLGWSPVRSQSTLALVESNGGCDLVTNCDSNRVCLDIVLTAGTDGIVQSYNLWVNYAGTLLSYHSDNACITDNGNDNNLNDLGHYRVSGVNGTTMVSGDSAFSLHTICFTYPAVADINNLTITVGGTLFGGVHSTLTFNNPPVNEPMLPEFPFLLNSTSVSCVLLPVQWLGFEAWKSGKMAELQWLTAEEYNIESYEVERSADGRSFQRLGEVYPQATGSAVHSYSFMDMSPLAGINYYRIRQKDIDGRFSYSSIRSLTFNEAAWGWSVFPNPAKDDFQVILQGEVEGLATLKLLNPTGQVIFNQAYDLQGRILRVDVSGSAPGLYTLVLETPGRTEATKVMIMR
jgi:hypothetical protein